MIPEVWKPFPIWSGHPWNIEDAAARRWELLVYRTEVLWRPECGEEWTLTGTFKGLTVQVTGHIMHGMLMAQSVHAEKTTYPRRAEMNGPYIRIGKKDLRVRGFTASIRDAQQPRDPGRERRVAEEIERLGGECPFL